MHSTDDKAGQKGIIMVFRLIDIENWERKEFYEHYRRITLIHGSGSDD